MDKMERTYEGAWSLLQSRLGDKVSWTRDEVRQLMNECWGESVDNYKRHGKYYKNNDTPESMKIVIWLCEKCDYQTYKDGVKTDKICMRCKTGVIYRVELDFEDKENA